jgi:hypothetical protein
MAPDFILTGQTTVVAGYSVAGERIFVIGPGNRRPGWPPDRLFTRKGGTMKRVLILVAFAVFAIGCMPGLAAAQQQPPAAANQSPTIKRTPLQKFDVPSAPLETVLGIAEIVPNVLIGRLTHPGMEGGYVLEGELVLMIDGQAPKTLKAGESYQIPLEAIHDAKSGPSGAKVLAVYVVRKGEPLATPAK